MTSGFNQMTAVIKGQHPGGAGSLEAPALSQGTGEELVSMPRFPRVPVGNWVNELGGWAASLAHLTRGRKAVRFGPVGGAHSPVRANPPPGQVRKGLQWLSSSSVPRQEPLRFRLSFVFLS